MNSVFIVFKKHPNIRDEIVLVCDSKDEGLLEPYENKREYYIEEHEVSSL